MSLIVLIVLLIAVLIISIYLLTHRTSVFAKFIEGPACKDQGGVCSHGNQCPKESAMKYAKGCKLNGDDDPELKQTGPCCVPVVE